MHPSYTVLSVGLHAMVQERPVAVERRLAAILAADVAGYSRLMHDDEEATHGRLTYLLAEAVNPSIAEYGGRIVKNTGDGFLAQFSSAVQAVRAAVQFQNRIRELTSADPQDARIAFRVGINVGDVIVEPHDIFGDGVNIAARLEGIAEPGGICIAASVYDQVQGKVGVQFGDLGEQALKNISRPVRAYALVSGTEPLGNLVTSATSSRPHLSIVVLPFANLSGDAQQDYFVDGVTESLTTDLSRIGGSLVIGRHTAFTYKGKAVDLRQIGRDLNIRYALEGSVQRSGNRLRVNVLLIDAETGTHIWADRFDKTVADLFDMQDEIVSRLANALNAQLIAAEARRAQRSPHPDATDMVFQGLACLYKGWTPKHLTQARGFFERAMALDPEDISPMLGVANTKLAASAIFFSDDSALQLVVAEELADRALSLAPNHPFAHLTLGGVYLLTNRAAQGISECERALALDRNLAAAHGGISAGKIYLGRAAEVEHHVLSALRLSPRDLSAYMWMFFLGLAKVHLGTEVEAVAWLQRSIEANRSFPPSHFNLAAAFALLGELDEARTAVRTGLALNPTLTLRRLRLNAPSDNPAFLAARERILEGLRLAGLAAE
jgi:TolB-like protein/class 3 adenylate cyclase